jgi:hypothetical protein
MSQEIPPNDQPPSEALEAVTRESGAEQRRGLQEKIFQASEILEATATDFAQREVLRHIFSATSRLLDADGFMPVNRTAWVMNQLTEALALLHQSATEDEE